MTYNTKRKKITLIHLVQTGAPVWQPRSQGLSSSSPPGAREKRTWLGLVTCLPEKSNPEGGVVCFWFFLSNSFCQFQIEACSIRLPRKSAAMFLSCLYFAVCKSCYSNINLKVKQVKCLEAIFFGSDVVAFLPTGYGKSLIFQLLPSLLHAKSTSCHKGQTSSPVCLIITVVSPLNALIKDQMRKSTEGNLSAAFLDVRKKNNSSDLELDVKNTSYSC